MTTDDQPSIAVHQLSIMAGKKPLLSGINFSLAGPGLVALAGPSGSGKSLLLNTLAGLLPPSSGSIVIDGEEATAWKPSARRRFWHEQAAIIHQSNGIVPELSVAANITLGRTRRGAQPVGVADVLSQVGLDMSPKQSAAVLSGGEQQRLGVARALHRGARYVFADEPTASLDSDNRAQIHRLLEGLAAGGALVLAATHDEALIAAADERIRLERGSAALSAQEESPLGT